MSTREEIPPGKVRYEKPTAVDLGAAAPVVGASCVPGNLVGEGHCVTVGNGEAGNCVTLGNSAGSICLEGPDAGAACADGVGYI